MTKDKIISMAQKYSNNESDQQAYIAGVQAVCSIVFQKINSCSNVDFCLEMETLSESCFIDFD
jgi:hypothetical protein